MYRSDGPIERRLLLADWRSALETFFRVLPESAADEDVLVDVLRTLTLCLRRGVAATATATATATAAAAAAAADHQEDEEPQLFQWLRYVLTKERHVFWVLFQVTRLWLLLGLGVHSTGWKFGQP